MGAGRGWGAAWEGAEEGGRRRCPRRRPAYAARARGGAALASGLPTCLWPGPPPTRPQTPLCLPPPPTPLHHSADFKTELSTSDMFDPRLQAVVLGVVDVSYGGRRRPRQQLGGREGVKGAWAAQRKAARLPGGGEV